VIQRHVDVVNGSGRSGECEAVVDLLYNIQFVV